MTGISRDFIECNLRSREVIEALKSSNHAVIDKVASKIYSNMLSVDNAGIREDPDWPKKDEKLKWILHTQVTVFGDILKIEDLLEQVSRANNEDNGLITDLAYELKFLLLDLLGLYDEQRYSTWNLMDLFTPDHLKEEQLLTFIKPIVQPSDLELIIAHEDNTSDAVLNQALTNWVYWSQVYKTLMILTYDAKEDETIVAFHTLLAVSAHLISASHMGSLLLLSQGRSVKRLDGKP